MPGNDTDQGEINQLRAKIAELEERGQYLADAVGSMLEGYQIIDREFRYVYVNAAAARHGQTTVHDLIGKKMPEAYPGIEATDVFGKIRAAIFAGETHYLTNKFEFPDGSSGHFELRIQPVPQGAVVFSIDVTERELQRERNEKLKERLMHFDRLDSVGRVTGGIAHDFNNMLTVLMMGFDVLEEAIADPERSLRELAQLRTETERAARVAEQLLAFSKKKLARAVDLNINDTIRSMQPMLHSVCAGKISLVLDLAVDLAPTHIDPGFMEQIILNLALNARDAMPAGGTLEIRSRNVTLDAEYVAVHATCPPGAYVLMTVHDTGTGISPDIIEKIFEPFFTTKPPRLGTGLGLATVYGLVRESGGAVEVYSEPGNGTSFKIYLPVAVGSVLPSATAPRKQPVKKSYSVLLVDDEPNLQRLISMLLQNAGHTVSCCGSMDEGLTAFEAGGNFDLIVTDMSMPGGSGIDLLEAINNRSPGLRAILISGHLPEKVELNAPGMAIRMLEKPFSRDHLIETIDALMNG
ncbi:MAG: response regulator [Spirochaetes bacterium]|nr:response regulator [Spirochaetota bacterium]